MKRFFSVVVLSFLFSWQATMFAQEYSQLLLTGPLLVFGLLRKLSNPNCQWIGIYKAIIESCFTIFHTGKTISEHIIKAMILHLSIEAIRLKDKFTYSINVDEDIDPLAVRLPSLLLQPFVENSIWHGIQPLDKKGVIKVKISQKESNLEAEIIDNGIGRTKTIEIMQSKKQNNKSAGVSITYKRLELLVKNLTVRQKLNIPIYT